MSIPILDLSQAEILEKRVALLDQLRDALFNVGFLYITNHGVSPSAIADLVNRLPALFDLPASDKVKLSKLNSPHFLGYSGFAEEITQGKHDLREQFDYASELPVIYQRQDHAQHSQRDFSKHYWRLRGPNQWPDEAKMPGFKMALLNYHAALSDLSYRFVHLVEEAFGIPVGTLDSFFRGKARGLSTNQMVSQDEFLSPQHRLKLIKYQPTQEPEGQGVGAHKDSSGWLTFLYQVNNEPGLEVLGTDGSWIEATPIAGSFVVNFGNAFEAATEGAVRATIHRVRAPTERVRYSIPFFMGLPLDLKVSEIQSYIPEAVRAMRRESTSKSSVDADIPSFLDPHWDLLGELQLRKWIRSHPDVGQRWYEPDVVAYYSQ